MLDVKDKRLYNYLSDYKLNIISPADIEDEDFDKFHSELGFVMRLIKHQSDDVKAIIEDTDNRLFSTDTAYFLKSTINLDLEYDEDEGGVDMCKGLEKSFKEERVKGAIEGMRIANMSEKDVINNIIQNFDVTEEYVLGIIEQEMES
jgi:hypothetical protein